MNQRLVYDIRTSENALSTLVNLTGVDSSIWEENLHRRSQFRFDDDLVEDVISRYGHFPTAYENWSFVYFHVTTSANRCVSFKKHGILDLRNSYLCKDSEFREFLDSKGIEIDIESRILSYGKHVFDITYGECPSRMNKTDHACWSVGRKFYYDYTTCGFLSVWNRSPYGGNVHCRPEILSDIDNLLGTNLSREWEVTHKPYEIVAIVPGTAIVYDSDDLQSDNEKILNYLTKAYTTAFGAPSEVIVLLKNHIQIPPSKILAIKPLSCW